MKNIYKVKDSQTKKIYTIDELRKLSDEDEILHRLVCINCGCPMTFTHDSASRRAFLKTWNRQNHDQNCNNYYDREERKVLYETGQIQNGRLNTAALNSRLKRMDRLLNEPKNSIKFTNNSAARKRNKHSVSEVTTDNTKRDSVTRISPTTDPSIAVIENGAHAHVRMDYRFIGTIGRKLIGRTIVIGGILEAVTIGKGLDPHVSFQVKYNGKDFLIRLRPDVFQRQVGFLNRIKSLRNILLVMDQKPILSAVVEIQSSTRGIVEAVLLDENALHINAQALGVYITLH
ncbi:hypothetical protein [Loigolactobacillus backii]|uniref:Uncharacterized protein n=1 Tax=Loigolactobacillus backii TaxID=375175 RepID=A0A192H2D6_9LACO|nr:hypothetical protein [Loigolactobacillus backii]ANK62974.1 hypothetical protein AYR53_09500 [Loigolactobacillus backii]ANK70018.1 hypothetical protein AYR56_07505 [Loigolactobacillus backii]MDA5388808.1 hypothetical protein [Loigolactobacillus backii]MDA5391305.1 hypothetical protein [Loigolactobacillus backii]PIO83373.1 hypothetical protein BSQ39_07300 [Loigolactobacillus backii]